MAAVMVNALLLFRPVLATLFSRTKSAAYGDKSVEFGEPTALAIEQKRQTVAVVEERPPSGELPPPSPPEALLPFSLAQSSEGVRSKVNIKWGAAAQLKLILHSAESRIAFLAMGDFQ
jgi:hypothetical protein